MAGRIKKCQRCKTVMPWAAFRRNGITGKIASTCQTCVEDARFYKQGTCVLCGENKSRRHFPKHGRECFDCVPPIGVSDVMTTDDIVYIQPHGPIPNIGEGATVIAERQALQRKIDALQESQRQQAISYAKALDVIVQLHDELSILRRKLAGQ